MFEQVLAFALKQLLGEFVEDSSNLQEKLSVGIWSGNIILENLVLKKEILSVLNLPIALSHGVIGRFELRIPWKRLGVDPVVVIIDGLHLLLEPRYVWNPNAKEDREQAVKQAKLAAIELLTSKRLTENPFQGYGDFATKWLMKSLVRKLLDNIQITVRDVHVRYEDQVSCPTNFCVGISFESLNVLSREHQEDFDAEEHYPGDIGGNTSLKKVLQINHLTIYWNPIIKSGIVACNSAIIGQEFDKIELLMTRTISRKNHLFIDRPRHHYILQPSDMVFSISVLIDSDMADIKVRTRFILMLF